MKELIDQISKDRIILYAFSASFLIVLLTAIFIVFKFNSLPPFIPIFNQLPWGNERLTPSIGIFIPLLTYLAVFVFNLLFSSFLYKKNNPLLSRIIASVSFMLSIINFLFIIKILFIFT